MSEPTAKPSAKPTAQPSAGKAVSQGNGPFFAFLLVLAALFGIVTAYAARNNPMSNNDQATYGISRYLFMQECKHELDSATNLPTTVIMQGQPVASDKLGKLVQDAKLLNTGETLKVVTAGQSREMLGQVQPIPEREGQEKRVGLQWQTPVQIHAVGSSGKRIVSPAVMQCEYDKAKGKPETSLFISQ